MAKTSKVSFRTYYNTRLKELDFHGRPTFPLYVQVVYQRKNALFKSYYFDLFSKPRYGVHAGAAVYGPDMPDLERMEAVLIAFVIERLGVDFSLEGFKDAYDFYGWDLCDAMEDGFREYLFTFLMDEGMPDLALTIREGGKWRSMYHVLEDLKRVVKPAFFNKLVDNAVFYAPPYLPLFAFTLTLKRFPPRCLSVWEWESGDTKAKFSKFVEKAYPAVGAEHLRNQVEQWIDSIKEGKV